MEGKQLILSAVLKQDLPFRASTIYNETALSRSLITYHLDQMVAKGWLEKNGATFLVMDKNHILDELVANGSRNRFRRATSTLVLTNTNVNGVHKFTEAIRAARVLELTNSLEMKQAWLEELDRTIRTLQDERKYLMGSKLSKPKARAIILKWDPEGYRNWLYVMAKELDFAITVSREQMLIEIQDKVIPDAD